VNALVALDWNHDFRTDIAMAGSGGMRLLLQDEKGGFTDATAKASGTSPISDDLFGLWAADIEMDGDIDIMGANWNDSAPDSAVIRIWRNNLAQ